MNGTTEKPGTASAEWRAHWPMTLAAMVGFSTIGLQSYGFGAFAGPVEKAFGWTREETLDELMPRAFVKSSRTDALIDLTHGYVAVDSSSRKTGENVMSDIRGLLGSFPAMPLNAEVAPRSILTGWIAGEELPTGLSLGEECEMKDPAEGGAVVKCQHQELRCDEIDLDSITALRRLIEPAHVHQRAIGEARLPPPTEIVVQQLIDAGERMYEAHASYRDNCHLSVPEVDYLVEAVNDQFPGARLTPADITACYAGVRPVLDDGQKDASKATRDHVVRDESGKLHVHRRLRASVGLTDAQWSRLLEVVAKTPVTPVTLVMREGATITSERATEGR